MNIETVSRTAADWTRPRSSSFQETAKLAAAAKMTIASPAMGPSAKTIDAPTQAAAKSSAAGASRPIARRRSAAVPSSTATGTGVPKDMP